MKFRLFVLLVLAYATNAFAIINLELTQGVSGGIPIVIDNIKQDDGVVGSSISDIMRADLRHSGRFHLISSKNQAELKPEVIVSGDIQLLTSGRYRLRLSLKDLYYKSSVQVQKKSDESAQIVQKNIEFLPGELRLAAHYCSDFIYQHLTGDSGIFLSRIAYVSVMQTRPGSVAKLKYELQVADVDGYNPQTLLSSTQPIMSPVWSPDGNNLVYVSFEGSKSQVFIQEVKTGKRRLVTQYPGINGAPSWSPDGKHLLLVLTISGAPKIYKVDLATNSLTQVTHGWSIDTEPNWSPDGRSFVFTSNRGGSPQVYRYNLVSAKVERVTFQGSYNARASVLPNGKGVVLLHRDQGQFSIAYQAFDREEMQVLAASDFAQSPSISANGRMILFATQYGDRGVLSMVSLDGRVRLRVPAQRGDIKDPAWSPIVGYLDRHV